MRHVDVLKAQAEAERFLRVAAEYQQAYHAIAGKEGVAYIPTMIERAALRRASLDLTRALAKMRRRER